MTPHRRLAWVPLLALALLIPARSSRAADAADPTVRSATTLGSVGHAERIEDIMRRQAAQDAAGERPLRDAEEKENEHRPPDRTQLPQNPESPFLAQFSDDPRSPRTASGPVAPFSPQVVGLNWTGATLSGINPTSSFPPDCMGAPGPTQYLVFVNGRLVSFNKTTGLADGALNADPDVFFASIKGSTFTSDPRIRYDRLTGRWFLIIINTSTPNRILFAVSDAASNGTITGSTVFTFFFIPIDTTPPVISSTCFADYPTLGVDANALYIGTNNFCGTGGSYNGTDGYVVRKSSIMGSGPLVVTAFRGLSGASGAGVYTPQGVDNLDPAATEGYFIGVDNVSYGLLQMRRVSNPGGTPTISSNLSLTVPATGAPVSSNHLGNTGGTHGRLDALDDRLFAAHIRGGKLWTAHNVGVNNTGVSSGTLTRDGSRWYQLNVPVGSGAPTLAQSGTVYTASGSNTTDQRNCWIPSIMVSGQGHAAMGFSTAGTNERANVATVGRLAGDAAGTMQTPALITNSTTAYNPPGDTGAGNGARRWGDYSYTAVDPVDDMTLWTVGEFCDATNSYGVRVAKLIAPPPATPSALADVTAGQNPVTLTLTGTSISGSGFYDPGANLPGVPAFSHLAATITNGAATGAPPAVVSAAYLTPSTVQLVLNAASATVNVGGEKYTITVTNPDGQAAAAAVVHVVGGAPSVATIAPGPSAAEGNGGTTAFAFTVNLSTPSASPVTIRYQTSDGTATVADNDYLAATDSVTIAAGLIAGTIPVIVIGDSRYEPNETFNVTLTGATGATLGATVLSTGTILNDEAVPALAIDDVSHPEGDSGTTLFRFTVSLSAASGVPTSLDFATADGAATIANNDYQAASGTLNFPAGTTTQTLDVLMNGDAAQEPDESFTVQLAHAVGATFADSVGTGTILNDDAIPLLSIANDAVPEGSAGLTPLRFAVSLSNPSSEAVTVHYQTADGTATLANDDYQAASGTLTIPALATSGTIVANVVGDSCGEANESFTVTLSSPVGAAIQTATGTGTILNDDDVTPPAVAVTAPNGAEMLEVASTVSLTWTATDSAGVRAVDILLSRDGGTTWPELLAAGQPNTGTYAWTVTPPAAAAALVQVRARDAGCNTGSDASDAAFQIADHVTAVGEDGPVTRFALGPVKPNPARGSVQFGYQLPHEAGVRLSVADVQGREIALLVSGTIPAGRHTVSWSGAAARGLYFVRYQAGGKDFNRRFALIR